jgi:hypothetical protein
MTSGFEDAILPKGQPVKTTRLLRDVVLEPLLDADRCPSCWDGIDNGQHPRLPGGQARRALCMGERSVMRKVDVTWGFEELPEPGKTRATPFPNRAARRGRR